MADLRGRNFRKLIVYKMSLLMIPPSTPEGEAFATGLEAMAKPGNHAIIPMGTTTKLSRARSSVRSKRGNLGRDMVKW